MKCKWCKLEKEESKFYKDSSRSIGYSTECIVCAKIRGRSYYQRTKLHKRRYHIQRNYKIDYEDYLKMYKDQRGCCAICEYPFEVLSIDHDHTSGKIRGLLCSNCNRGLGMFKENTYSLTSAIDYLKNSKELV